MPRPARLFPCLCFVAIAFDWLDSLYQIIARRECEISKTVPKNRNEFCLPNVTHDRISVTSLFFTIFSSLRHTHTPFTHRFRLDVYTPCFSLFCFVFRFVFFFFFFFRTRSLFIYLLFVSLYLFSVLDNHNASINRRIELKLLAGFAQINWQFCMSKRSSPWASMFFFHHFSFLVFRLFSRRR